MPFKFLITFKATGQTRIAKARVWITTILILSLPLLLLSQDTLDIKEGPYGKDPLLFNGRIYTYYLPANTGGNQYLLGDVFSIGGADIRGVHFTGLELNYDIYNQEVLLKSTDQSGGTRIIELSKAWLEGFSMDNRRFELIPDKDNAPVIYQVSGKGPYRFLYRWTKLLDLDISYGASNYVFMPAQKDTYLQYESTITKFNKNKVFISLFPAGKQQDIKRFMRQNRIRVNKAGEEELEHLINYCNTL